MSRTRFSVAFALAILIVCAAVISPALARPGTSSSAEGRGRIKSATLTKKSFNAAEASKVKLSCEFKPAGTIFAYVLSFKKGKAWTLVKSVKKTGSFKTYVDTAKQLFAGKPIKAGEYRLRLSADRNSKTLAFTVTSLPVASSKGLVFDDFSYTSVDQLEAHHWIVRTGAGWPGSPEPSSIGAT